ncbi:MAG: hypothetical protein M0Q00_00415 [Acholeplasmataceae bacterium]|nr:hypothetical protein [Acholeplasmataceae bacterium]
MADVRYIAELVITDKKLSQSENKALSEMIAEDKLQEEQGSNPVLNQKPEKSTSKNLSSSIQKGASVGLAVATLATTLITTSITTNAELRGDFHSSQQLKNNVAIGQEIGGVGATLAFGAAFGGPAGFAVAATAVATQYAIRAFNVAMETKRYVDQVEKDKYRSAIEQQRLIRDISGVRR